MDLFPNGGFVRLRSRGNRNYVHADRDWVGVSLRPLALGTAASPLQSVWRVEHWPVAVNQEVIFLQLQNAAYGRYLSFSPLPAQRGHRGRRVVQGDRNEPPNNFMNAFVWRVERVDPNEGYVRLRFAHDFDLRANGRHRRWYTGVTADVNQGNALTTMMQWTVQIVAGSPLGVPPPLPAAPQPQIQEGRRGMLFWRRARVHQHPAPRTIRYVRASYEGHFDQNHHNWPSFLFHGYSVFNLRMELGQLQHDWNEDMLAFTLCILPGSHGRLMPLLTDLPRSVDPMNIIVLRTGSSAALALVYPQIYAPAQ